MVQRCATAMSQCSNAIWEEDVQLALCNASIVGNRMHPEHVSIETEITA